MAITGGKLLARALSAAEVREVFTLHGGHLDAFLMACDEHGIRLTDTRHEASAGHAADAYARITGDVGVCVVTSGPGFTNVYSAIVNAFLDRSPVLFIVGAPPLREAETNSLQGGFDQIACAAPVTKWAYRFTDPRRIPEMLALAIRKATTGTPGPVLLEIPIDVMFDEVDPRLVRYPANYRLAARPAPSQSAVTAALDLLGEAKNPAIIVGGGVANRLAGEALVAFAEAVGVPAFHLNKGDGAIPATHRLAGGGAGELWALAAIGAPTPDVVFLVGCRTGLFSGGRTSFFPNARLVHVDVDGAEIGRIYDVEVPIVADCREALCALRSAAQLRNWPDWSEWIAVVGSVDQLHASAYTDPSTKSGRIHPYFAAKAVIEACPPETVFILDGGETPAWAEHFTRAQRIGGILRLGYLGCLGVGPGYAIGAARALPGSPIVLISGDGAAGFHIQEFDTMARHHLPITTAIFNNASWGMSIHGQEALAGPRGIAVTLLADSHYERAAEAFGGRGLRVVSVEDIGDAMRAALAASVPTCLNLEVDPDAVHPITTMMLGDVTSEDQIVIPYYENMPR